MTIYLVRHAHAGSRSGFSGTDFDRPLTPKGRHQAAHLQDLVAGVELQAVCSSAFTRCVETVSGIAEAHGLPVKVRDELMEGASAADVVELMASFAGRNAVLCSHGDVIPKVLRRLSPAGIDAGNGNVAAKGSLWVLDVDADGQLLSGSYEPPADD